jgi:hypothetical protein
MRHQQGVYFDGHERDDVRAYRKSFLEKIFSYAVLMDKYGGDDMTVTELPELAPGQQKHVLIVHDESLFYSNEDQGSMWCHPKHPPSRKKGKGKCIMVSEFLCECHGRLWMTLENGEKEYATHSDPIRIRHVYSG